MPADAGWRALCAKREDHELHLAPVGGRVDKERLLVLKPLGEGEGSVVVLRHRVRKLSQDVDPGSLATLLRPPRAPLDVHSGVK